MLTQNQSSDSGELSFGKIESKDVLINSESGPLRGKITTNVNLESRDAIILCPGLAVGMEGPFVKAAEDRMMRSGLAKWSVRFNFSGHSQDEFNTDVFDYTFSKGKDDFSAAVRKLKEEGAERVVAICSSTGTQSAVLAGCKGVEGEKVDLILARSPVLDCFVSFADSFPDAYKEQWRQRGEFQIPVSGQAVRFGSEFLNDVELNWKKNYKPSDLLVPLVVFHGSDDKVVPLAVVQNMIKQMPPELVNLKILSGAGHDLSEGDDTYNLDLLVDEFVLRMSEDKK